MWLWLLTAVAAPAIAQGRYLFFSPLAVGGAVLTQMEGFPAKVHTDGALGFGFEFFPLRWVGIGTSIRYHWTLPSTTEGGFIYRGHSGPEGRLFLTVRHPDFHKANVFFLGIGADVGGLARFDSYTNTSLYFFYPGVFIQPFFDFTLNRNHGVSYRIFGLVDLYFRRDLRLSAGSGIGLSIRFSPF